MASPTNHVLTVTDDSTERTYTDIIPLDGKAGYVEIIDHFHGAYHKFLPTELKENITYKTVTIKRHSQNTVIIEAKLDNKIAIIVDPSYPGSQHYCKDPFGIYGFSWKPWTTNAITSHQDKYKFVREDKLRGGNRLTIDLDEPSAFTITIPIDCDIKVDTKQTPVVKYLTPAFPGPAIISSKVNNSSDILVEDELIVPTKFSVEAESVNMCGDSGCGGTWRYFWGTDKDPVTAIFAKGAKVFVPTKNMPMTTHHRFWLSCTASENNA